MHYVTKNLKTIQIFFKIYLLKKTYTWHFEKPEIYGRLKKNIEFVSRFLITVQGNS